MIALGFVNARNPSGPAEVDSTVSARKCPKTTPLTKSPVAAGLSPAKR